jgi:hypothetical protein
LNITQVDVHEYPDKSDSIEYLEDGLKLALQRHFGPPEGSFENLWMTYRRRKWATGARVKALIWDSSDSAIANRIKRLAEEKDVS